jgi:alpha-L-fucosidase
LLAGSIMTALPALSAPEAKPNIARFDQLAYGLFLHWGLYSTRGRGEWIQHDLAIEYEPLIKQFTAADFDAAAIARLAREASHEI